MSDALPLHDEDIVILAPSEWRDNAVSNMQIAALLSETNQVLYVETIGGRMPRPSELGRILRRLKRMVFRKSIHVGAAGLNPRNVSILTPFAVPVYGKRVGDWLNRKLLVFQVQRSLARLSMGRPVVWSFSPRWQSVAEALNAKCRVFHCVDALHTYDQSARFRCQFKRAVQTADVVLTPGVLLKRELCQLNPSTYLVGHGCDPKHLEYRTDGCLPEDLKAIPEPRAVYTGTLANWVDYDLMIEVATRLASVSFVLIGYVHALAPRDKVERLIALPNVFHLGYKNFEELPTYYRHAAVGIVPYDASNEHIHYSTPTKYLDYLAAGLPVVSTSFPAADGMEGLVTTTAGPETFAEALRSAIRNRSDDGEKRRRDYAAEHTWPEQVNKMCEPIRECLCARQR